jgi:hypothetical protein
MRQAERLGGEVEPPRRRKWCAPGRDCGVFPGNYCLSRDKFYELSASTQHGEQVKARGIIGASMVFGTSSYTVWQEKLGEVIFSSHAEGDKNWIYAILRPTSSIKFNKSSKTVDDNPYFGNRRFGMDWLEFENSVGRVAARKRGDNMMDIILIGDHDCDAIMTALDSIRLGFSFLEGKNLEMHGCEAMCGNTMYHWLFSGKPSSKGAFPIPLHNLRVPNEVLLGLSSQFFDSKLGRRFSDYLRMCWNVSDNMGTVGAIIASTTVEAMVRMLVKAPAEDGSVPPDAHLAQQQKLAGYLERRKHKYGENFVNRVHNMVAKGNPINVKKILRSWARRSLMNLTPSEVNAWDDVRNSSAHGKLLFLDTDTSKTQKNYNKRKQVENIVNKLTFQAIGILWGILRLFNVGSPAIQCQ